MVAVIHARAITLCASYRLDGVSFTVPASTFKAEGMVRWRVGELLKAKKWTRYRLVQESGLAVTVVYRIASSRGQIKRVDGRTLDALCTAFGVGPGDLLEYIPDSKGISRRRVK